MKLEQVYNLWVENGRCTSARLAVLMGVSEAVAHQKLNAAILAHSSGVFGNRPVTPDMQMRNYVPGKDAR